MIPGWHLSDVTIDRWNTLFKHWKLKSDFNQMSTVGEFITVQLNMFEEMTKEIESLKNANRGSIDGY